MNQKFHIRWMTYLAMAVFSFAPQTHADEAMLLSKIGELENRLVNMQKVIDLQSNKLNQLESRNPRIQMAAPSGENPAAVPMSDYEFNERLSASLGGANKWLKDLSFKGDLRLRYEAFDFTSGHPGETDPRNRFRFRLRYGFEKKFSEDLKVGFSMASGENNAGIQTDPTSTNQSFDNLFNFKDIWIEKAYASYSPPFLRGGPIEKLNITAGKFDNPFEKGSSDMVWDRDVKPEGVYEKIDINLLDGEDVDLSSYVTAGQFVLDEDGTVGGDAELFAYQLGLNAVVYTPFMERPIDWLGAVSFYSYNDYAVKNNFTLGGTALTSGTRGNSNFDGVTTELDAGDFEIWNYYSEIAIYPHGVPIRPFIDVAHNVANAAVNDEGLAWALGSKIGGIAKKGDWEATYAYKRIEADSVVGAFNDSDFGNGHTGKRGSVIKAGYALTDNVTANVAAYFVNNLATGTGGVRDEEQRRFQLDLVWKF